MKLGANRMPVQVILPSHFSISCYQLYRHSALKEHNLDLTLTFALTFSNDAWFTSEKQMRKTSCKKKKKQTTNQLQ
jgi:hypothetical protein